MTESNDNQAVAKKFSRDAVVVFAAKIGYLLTRFALPPLVLSYVTLEEYGTWSATFVLIGYLGMSAIGWSNVYIRYVAQYQARQETEKINRLLTTGLALSLSVSTVLLLVTWFGLPGLMRRLGLPLHLHSTGFELMFGAAAIFLLDLSLGAFSHLLYGMRKIVEQTWIWIASFCLEAVLIVTLLLKGFGIYALLWAFVARYLLAVFCQVALSFRLMPQLSLRWRYLDRSALRLFLGYGSVVQASSLLGMFLYSIEKLLAGIYLGVAATGVLDIAEKLPVLGSQLPATINSVFLPTLAHLQTQQQHEAMRELYRRGTRYLNLATGLLMGFLAAFAAPLMRAWIGADERFSMAATIFALMTLPYQMHELTGPSSALHRASGKPQRELVYPLSQLALVALGVTLGFVFIGKSLLVICGAVAIGMTASSLIYLSYTHRLLGLTQRQLWGSVMLPGLLPYACGLAVRWCAPISMSATRWPLLGALFIAGLVYAAVVLPVVWFAVCEEDERAFVRQQAQTLALRFGPWLGLNVTNNAVKAE